ncbi:DUF559 domain-containing protein [bacterium]|nr:MAG: DUF559 domain-containing protein [bacterium]
MGTLYNQPVQTEKRRDLRNHATRSEKLLWSHLKGKQLSGFKFRRQHGVGPYVLDFYCPEAKLAIEIDGASHDSDDAKTKDQRRQAFIEEFGVRFLRFKDTELFENPNKVLEKIKEELGST